MFLQHHQNDIAGNLCQGEKYFNCEYGYLTSIFLAFVSFLRKIKFNYIYLRIARKKICLAFSSKYFHPCIQNMFIVPVPCCLAHPIYDQS